MAKFYIPPEMSPGVYRAGVGFFVPGQTLELPDEASVEGDVPSSKFYPLDAEALAWLRKAHKGKKFELFDPSADEKKAKPRRGGPVSDGAVQTPAQAAGGGTREADRL